MKKSTLIVVLIAIVVAAGATAYFLTPNDVEKDANYTTDGSNSSKQAEASDTSTQADEIADAKESEKSDVTIIFTDKGFNESTYTVKSGHVVTVKNDSSMQLQFSSDDHPTHTEDPEINMSTLAPGESGTFTPTTKGTHGFHDHINDQYTGTLVVE